MIPEVRIYAKLDFPVDIGSEELTDFVHECCDGLAFFVHIDMWRCMSSKACGGRDQKMTPRIDD